ncbi:malonyl CoA-acyl carrier protein transacylase, putative [Geobacter metallireducens RCH3]|uniref:[acyl-carrier-protein] S-malonyltransferase n=1 Tax=Geobacter metallireducens (strain ATCC 53774 / DSM 7210 / GS-15) TaxID=269799 RepID=Q39V02_GEOMG|nr:acyltransferase domain-containing protein [Geobacter metallireducens]ABB31922.2 malonyl-CoA--acyl carrier protein transacylase [Geobacter metallireducens GS-15]EHP84976.1 malonyl CoA-acyl carrier protein transacylase, putative [Geobacter metallireducens RCH3]
MICFMFPGQPLTFETTVPDDPDFRQATALTLDRTGLDLADSALLGEGLTEHVRLQVYGVAMSLYRCRRLRREGTVPAIIAEHSMGIYPAMAACGALDDGDALELTCRIGACIAAMGTRRSYALGCVTGLTAAPLMAVAENNGVFLANYNTSRHFLLSGERRNVEDAVAEALNNGAFTARSFPCDAPLHSPLMEEVAGELREVIGDYRFREPVLPLMSHIDQDYLSAADLPEFLVRELSLPVYWERTFQALSDAGVSRFVEVGVGDSLKKYNRWIASEGGR